MDDSKSSDVLSESTHIFSNSTQYTPADTEIMTNEKYELMVRYTKSALQKILKDIKKATFAECFINVLDDCNSCISQSLHWISDLLSETNIKIDKLIEYMSDTACVLQLLSNLIKTVIESISVSCDTMKEFPTVTGHIILLVFTHCKDSESIYGTQLNSLEKYIKDLFRICHELQTTYLTALEKYFIFDFSHQEELDVLIEALDINLKIGEIVQSLDVKTMAEQWKTYTVICEKYSTTLIDKSICNDCTKILCAMITNNIKTALQENQEHKVVLRSLKVSNFILKILLRVCITFKHATNKDYDSIMELLLYVNLNNDAYLHRMCGKSSQLISLFTNNVSNPMNTLLGELLYDDKFLQCIFEYDVHSIRVDDKLLGLILLVISTIRSLLQKGGDQLAKLQKHRLINVIYGFLPICHIWFNMGLTFKCSVTSRQYQTIGLYEYLLTHTVTLASMMILEEINILERRMLEALLGTDCTSAIFTANLWMLLARISSRPLLLSQVVSLIKIYQKLETLPTFVDSPQRIHLSHTIERLFKMMANDDKHKIYNMFSICDEKNASLWRCLKISQLPNEVQCQADDIVLEQFKTQIRKLVHNNNVEIDSVIQTCQLASTCSYMGQDDEVKSLLIEAWTNACPNCMKYTVNEINSGTLWFHKYIEALVAVTDTIVHIFEGNSKYLVKVLHIISSIVQGGCKELNLLLIDILCKLASIETNDMNKRNLESIIEQTFGELFNNSDLIVRYKLFNTLRTLKGSHLSRIISNVVNNDESLKEMWTNLLKHGRLKKNINISLKEQLLHTMDFEYSHKCIKTVDEMETSEMVSCQKSLSNNFDLIDVDSLFESESDEPVYKKAKLDINEIDGILNRLETDTSLLSELKENVITSEYKTRIKCLCNKLYDIIN